CVSGAVETYGMVPGIQGEQRAKVLERFKNAYAPAIGLGSVMDYLGTTGIDSLAGADILKSAPQAYSSTVTYPGSKVAQKLRGVAQVHLANLGTRVFYLDHGSFDTHASQLADPAKLSEEA